MIRMCLLYFVTFVFEIVAGAIPILWLHNRVASWFLIPASIAGLSFLGCLRLHTAPRQTAYTVYAAIYLIVVMCFSLVHD